MFECMHMNFQRIFSNQSIDINVRWMAILCFKQGVEKYWRKNIQQYVLLLLNFSVKNHYTLKYLKILQLYFRRRKSYPEKNVINKFVRTCSQTCNSS